ncbi:hypothetical protein [Streptomyces sp. NPDC002962]|uniref:hypothetical protein n=1 Tax=Streptomyces sp. NPDC002962 TaxID=3364674 RepID=UPI0036C8B9E0
MVGAYRVAGELAAAGGDHRTAFARYKTVHHRLVDKKHQIGPNVRLMVPKTAGGRCVRDVFARLPLMNAIGAVERLTRAKGPRLLPDYSPAA